MNRQQTIEQIFEVMGSMKQLMHAHYAQMYGSLELTPSQLHLLVAIDIHQPVSPKRLAQLTQLTPGAISQTLLTLETAHLVDRRSSEQDRRVIYLSPSVAGSRKLSQLRDLRKAIFTKAFSSLSDSQLTNYLDIQAKITDWFTSESSKGAIK